MTVNSSICFVLCSSFDMNDRFLQKDDGPIAIPTILHLSSTGGLLGKYGANK